MTPPKTPPRLTPPSGVQRAIEAGASMSGEVPVGEFDDESPSEVGRPVYRRRATKGDIDGLRTEVKTSVESFSRWAEKDAAEHKMIVDNALTNTSMVSARMSKIDHTLELHDAKLDDQTTTLNRIDVELAKTSTHVGHLVTAFERSQNADVRIATTQQQLADKDLADAKKTRRAIWKSWMIGVIGLAIAGGTIIVEHLLGAAFK